MNEHRNVTKGVIETLEGRALNLLDPQPEMFTLAGIATSLSRECRFGRQTSVFYSVAEHSLLCLRLMRQRADDLELLRGVLFHDAHEAYLGDIPTPIKKMLGESWHQVVERLDVAIATALGLDPASFTHPEVKDVDRLALSIEAHALMPCSIGEWESYLIPRSSLPADAPHPEVIGSQADAAEAFLSAARELGVEG